MWNLEVSKKFIKQLRKLAEMHDLRILDRVLRELCLNPHTQPGRRDPVQVATRPGLFRKWINFRRVKHRILYALNEARHAIKLLELRKRDDGTYVDPPSPDNETTPIEHEDLLGQLSNETSLTEADAEDLPSQLEPDETSREQSEDAPLPEENNEYVASQFWQDIDLDPTQVCRDYGIPRSEWGAFAEVASIDELRRLNTEPLFIEILLETIKDLEDEEEPVEQPAANTRLLPDGLNSLGPLLEGTLKWEDLLLALDERQQEFVDFAFDAGGPVMIRGGPGSGKSTVGLYRVKKYVDEIASDNPLFVDQPRRVLYTTFTNALVSESKQTLSRLLGDRLSIVDVKTSDMVIKEVATRIGSPAANRRADDDETAERIKQFVAARGSSSAEAQVLDSVGIDYLVEEIDTVIFGAGIFAFAQYDQLERTGRRQGLTRGENGQRAAVWRIKEHLGSFSNKSWSASRFEVFNDFVRYVREGRQRGVDFPAYDAIIVDENQDLDPVCLGIFIGLLGEGKSSRLFVTEDPNQSTIRQTSTSRYGQIHPDLNFVAARTGLLRKNYRTTRKISLAAESYLARNPDIEITNREQEFAVDGVKPHLFRVDERDQTSSAEQPLKIASFIDDASRSLQMPVGYAAVFANSNQDCRDLAASLTELGLPAEWQTSKTFNPKRNKIKVMPLRAAKGLEFPIVAVAVGDGSYPHIPQGAPDEVLRDFYETERKLLYVAMTRAMRALLVCLPDPSPDPLFHGFDTNLWEAVSLD